MRCVNCGASLKATHCEYCGSFIGTKTEQAKKITLHEKEIDKVLNKIKYFESSHAPENVKKRKIELLYQELENLGYRKQ